MKKIVFVCLGNICRSPMAEFVMKDLTDDVYVESRATSDWEHGNPIHSGTQAIFKKYAIPYDKSKTSQQISQQDFVDFDYIIGMDKSNFQLHRENIWRKYFNLKREVCQILGTQVILTRLIGLFWQVVRNGLSA